MAEKRKGLMATLAEYQREEKQKRTYKAKAGKPKMAKKAAKAKIDSKKAYSYNKRLDQSLGARNGKKSQSMKDRRDESKGAEKAAGKPAYSGNKSSSQSTSKPKVRSGADMHSRNVGSDGRRGPGMPSNPPGMRQTRAGAVKRRRARGTGLDSRRTAPKLRAKRLTTAERRKARRGR